MSPIPASSPNTLPDALAELSMAQDIPDARLLDEVVRRYPEFGDELTEFAVALALDAQRARHTNEPALDPKTISPAVRRSLQHFQDRLGGFPDKIAPQHEAPGSDRPHRSPVSSADPPNPFQCLDRSGFRALAERLNANAVFVCKLRDRQIDPDTLPLSFQRRVAKELDITLSAIQAHFAARPTLQAGQYFKADGKPHVGARQSFEEAVRSSNLTEAQQRALLKA